jgi:hypothetical protein
LYGANWLLANALSNHSIVLAVPGAARSIGRSCIVYPGMAPLDHIFRYHSFPSLREAGSPQSCGQHDQLNMISST